MARLVVLRFEDDQLAEDFSRSLWEGNFHTFDDLFQSFTTEMMVQTPTKFCDCRDRIPRDGWKRYGAHDWLLHDTCGKPSVGWGNNARAVICEAVDLLEKPSGNTRSRIEMANRRSGSTVDPSEPQCLRDTRVDVPTSNSVRVDPNNFLDNEDDRARYSSLADATRLTADARGEEPEEVNEDIPVAWPTFRDESRSVGDQ